MLTCVFVRVLFVHFFVLFVCSFVRLFYSFVCTHVPVFVFSGIFSACAPASCFSVCLVCLSDCLSVCPPIRLSVRLSIWHDPTQVHERSVDTDLLCFFAKRLMVSHPDLRLVVMSATLSARLVSNYYGLNTLPLFVGSKRFPVR